MTLVFSRFCPKCGNLLWIDEGELEGYNRYDRSPLYSARVRCSNYTIFSGHYSEPVRHLTREEYNLMAKELLKKP